MITTRWAVQGLRDGRLWAESVPFETLRFVALDEARQLPEAQSALATAYGRRFVDFDKDGFLRGYEAGLGLAYLRIRGTS